MEPFRFRNVFLALAPALVLASLLAAAAPAAADPLADARAGLLAARQGDHRRALALLTGAIESGELSRHNAAVAHNVRGFVYARLRRYELAIADFTRVIELEPASATARFYRARAFESAGRRAEAVADYRAALRLNPEHAGARAALARLEGQK